ncbi:MAG TPA: metallophosphoesterase family protein, partial [Gaiellaceae bacterium]|nr:metallophosphoesterase family protein [Gaiellaceae bacterium]
ISDTHLPRGARRIPEACLERLRASELILHAGDVTAASVLAELEAIGPPVHAVHGNMDDAELRELLPEARVVDVGGLRIGMTHDPGPGAGREERLLRRFPGCAAVVYGYTHQPQLERVGEVWILNPGSPTERRRAPSHTMLVLEVARETITPELIALS